MDGAQQSVTLMQTKYFNPHLSVIVSEFRTEKSGHLSCRNNPVTARRDDIEHRIVTGAQRAAIHFEYRTVEKI